MTMRTCAQHKEARERSLLHPAEGLAPQKECCSWMLHHLAEPVHIVTVNISAVCPRVLIVFTAYCCHTPRALQRSEEFSVSMEQGPFWGANGRSGTQKTVRIL